MAGVFHNAGFFDGINPKEANEGNHLGYFEDLQVTEFNWCLLKPFVQNQDKLISVVPLEAVFPMPSPEAVLAPFFENQPFCIKDPHLARTYPVWKAYLPGAVRLVTFRDPVSFLQSVRRLSPALNPDEILDAWVNYYEHVFKNDDGFVYVSFESIMSRAVIPRLAKHFGLPYLFDFHIKPETVQFPPQRKIPERCAALYARLVAQSA